MKSITAYFIKSILLISFIFTSGCEKEVIHSLSANPGLIIFSKDGGSHDLVIETDADSWNIDNPASEWLHVSNTSGTEGSTTVKLTVNTKSLNLREETLTITAGNAAPVNVVVKQAASTHLYSLSANTNSLNFQQAGNSVTLNIQTDAPLWSISSNVDWLQFDKESGSENNASVQITALDNTGSPSRSATITLTAEGAPSYQISVTQKGDLYPSYNTSPLEPDASGMASTATELATKIKLGWNLGNSLEATASETAWGNPKTTKALIDLVKQNGFNAVRIPAAWNQYLSNNATAQIRADWLSRVQEVVQYCIDNEMYVILNIHWDGGWLENNVTPEKQEVTNAKQKAFWEQIATHFRDYDEHLLFASANEPHVENATQMAVLNSYHQTFINAVRSTGGKNSYRVLIIQGPTTDIDKTYNLMTELPVDQVQDRMMAEVHFYTPWNFCGLEEDASWGKMFYYWGNGFHSTSDPNRNATWGEEATIDAQFEKVKSQFVDKGIPVVLGEYGAIRRSNLTGEALQKHLASRAYYLKYVTKKAKENGLLPFYWDNGGTGNHGFGIFNRNNNTVADQQALDALNQGFNE